MLEEKCAKYKQKYAEEQEKHKNRNQSISDMKQHLENNLKSIKEIQQQSENEFKDEYEYILHLYNSQVSLKDSFESKFVQAVAERE
mgnify:CR=1 FL=1|jgi:hypothetical protein